MSRFAAVRLSHFLPSLLLLISGMLVARLAVLSEFFTSLFNVLPTLLLLLGGAFCLVYGRQREVFLLLTLYLAYFLLDTQVDHFRASGQVRSDAALTFHLCSLLLPLLYALYAAWQERTHLLQDLVARAAVMLAIGAVAVGLMQRFVRQPSWQLIKGESPYERSYGETPRPRVMRCAP